jgi:hypothetical protein
MNTATIAVTTPAPIEYEYIFTGPFNAISKRVIKRPGTRELIGNHGAG